MVRVVGTEKISNPLQKSGLSKKSLCDYVINVASGCLHGCTFCYVPSTPAIRVRQAELIQQGVNDPQLDWGKYLLIRSEIPEKLSRILEKKRTWNTSEAGRGVVLLCSGTDPYQNKRVASLTRAIVIELLRFQKPVRILTRSPLWIQDLDILVNPLVTVGMSLPHLDDNLSKLIEPYAPSPSTRLKALEKGLKAGCRLYIAMAPTPPQLSFNDFISFFESIRSVNPEVIFWEPINARGSNGKRMLAAGLDFAQSVMSQSSWAENFIRQWGEVEIAAQQTNLKDKLHIWPDPELKKFIGQDEIDKWLYRPTVEKWPL
jgi:DNA repair photolyase